MRLDMYHVLRETPTRGGHYDSISRQICDIEDSPRHESLKRRHSDMRGKGYRINPLCRFLRKQAGRPWDRIHSEFCAVIGKETYYENELRTRLKYLVATHVFQIDGVLYHGLFPYRGLRRLDECWAPEFYVDGNGTLRVNRLRVEAAKARKLRRKEARDEELCPNWRNRRIIDAETQLIRLGGIWYQVEVTPIPDNPVGASRSIPIDAIRHRPVNHCPQMGGPLGNRELFGSPRLYARSKRQLGKSELARYGLKNDTH